MTFKFAQKSSSLTAFSVIAAAAAFVGFSNSVHAADILLRYEFDNGAADTSGFDNHGTINGAVVAGGVAVFNNPSGVPAANQFIALPSAGLTSLNTDSFSIAVRYKSTDEGLINGRLFGNSSLVLDYNDGGKDVSYAGLLGTFVVGRDGPLSVNGDVTDGNFHWQVLVVDRGTQIARHYVDGVKTGETTISAAAFSFSNLYLGANSGGLSYGARQTEVDELRIYRGVDLPTTLTGPVSTPDGGGTLAMLGLGAVGLLGMRARGGKD